jgi:hypothetical protein
MARPVSVEMVPAVIITQILLAGQYEHNGWTGQRYFSTPSPSAGVFPTTVSNSNSAGGPITTLFGTVSK